MRKGRKVEEFQIRHTPAVLRFDENHWEFTIEVDGREFRGDNPKELKLQADAFVAKHEGLKWEPLIVIDPDPFGSEPTLSYRRMFRAKSGREMAYRKWRIQGKDEAHWDMSAGTEGTPGFVADPPRAMDRVIPFTPARWKALVDLEAALKAAIASAKERLEKILREGDLDAFLEEAGRRGPPAILFDPGKGDK